MNDRASRGRTTPENKDSTTPEDAGANEEQTSETPQPRATTESNREDGRYEVDYLVRNSASLLETHGAPARPTIVAGALAGSDRKTHTLAQARELLQAHVDAEHDPNEGAA